MHIEDLNESNYILYCAKNYDSRHYSSTDEFFDDLKRVGYIKKLLTRYIESGELKERLILNHIIILYNVFGAEATSRILFFKLADYQRYIKPFLLLLNILPARLHNIDGVEVINTDCIEMDIGIINALRKIDRNDKI